MGGIRKMKFGDYVKKDKLLNQDKKNIKECSGKDEFDEETKLLHTVMNFTQTLCSSKCILKKTECILVIFNILVTHLNKFIKNTVNDENGGIMFEKK